MATKKKRMTDKQYVDIRGIQCPHCHSENISGNTIEVDAGEATQEVGCDDCGATWLDAYKLVGYIPQDPL